MRKLLYLVTLLIFTCCFEVHHQSDKKISGKYIHEVGYGFGSTIEIMPNQTFHYSWVMGLYNGDTFGVWKMEGDSVILNSNLRPPVKTHKDFNVTKLYGLESDSLFIKVMAPDNVESFPFVNCVLKSDATTLTETSTDSNGETVLAMLEADSLILTYGGYKTVKYKLDNLVSAYVFNMEPIFSTFRYFEDEVWKYKDYQLLDTSATKYEKLEDTKK